MPGNNSLPIFQASGAYIFRPLFQKPDCLSVKNYTVFNGNQFTEVHQVFNNWISQTIRLYTGAKNAEFEWQVGPLDISDNIGKEVVIRFQSDLKSNSLFYTDSNGREMLTRKRDFRPTWPLEQTEPVAGNYYPVNSRIIIRDEAAMEKRKSTSKNSMRQLTFVNDRSQGGSSILDGSVEIMLHRRTLYDDSLGVGEPISETVLDKQGLVVNGIISMIFETVDKSARLHRELAHEVNNKPLITFAVDAASSENFRYLSGWSAIATDLPLNLHLLTFAKEFENDRQLNALLVRIEHFYEKDEDSALSLPVTVDLRDAFNSTFNIVGVEELALGANMRVEELNDRLRWNSDYELESELNQHTRKIFKQGKSNDFTFTFNPMEIRTFRLFFLPK